MDSILNMMAQRANEEKIPHYSGDLIHDGFFLCRNSKVGEEFYWIFKNNGCGTYMSIATTENLKLLKNQQTIKTMFKITVKEINNNRPWGTMQEVTDY